MIRIAQRAVLSGFVLVALAQAQFKETPAAPYSSAVARVKIRALLGSPDSAKTLAGLLVWYRDVIDDELIAAWKGDARASVPPLMTPLADARVASSIVEYSWREQRAATFTLAYAPMLGDLMARYPASAGPVLADVLGQQTPDLSGSEAEALCRILLDMPDTANWKKVALQVLPHYRLAAQMLLAQDMRASDQEKSYRAQFWMQELRWNAPLPPTNNQPRLRSRQMTLPSPQTPTQTSQSMPNSIPGRPHIVGQSAGQSQPADAGYVPQPYIPGPVPMAYTGPRSGTLKCSGGPVPPDGEYTFPGMPMGNLQVDLEGKPWEARLLPGSGQTQDLIIRNKSASAQKRCTVHWTLMP
jgi:hypothetical protein